MSVFKSVFAALTVVAAVAYSAALPPVTFLVPGHFNATHLHPTAPTLGWMSNETLSGVAAAFLEQNSRIDDAGNHGVLGRNFSYELFEDLAMTTDPQVGARLGATIATRPHVSALLAAGPLTSVLANAVAMAMQVPAFAPSSIQETAYQSGTSPGSDTLLHLRLNIRSEASALLNFGVNSHMHCKTFMVAYIHALGIEDHMQTIVSEIKRLGFPDAIVAAFPLATHPSYQAAFPAAVNAFATAAVRPTCTIMLADASVALGLIPMLHTQVPNFDAESHYFLATSQGAVPQWKVSGTSAFFKNVYQVMQFPHPTDTRYTFINNYKAAMGKLKEAGTFEVSASFAPNNFAVEGYAAGRFAIEAVKKLNAGQVPSRTTLKQSVYNAKVLNLDELSLGRFSNGCVGHQPVGAPVCHCNSGNRQLFFTRVDGVTGIPGPVFDTPEFPGIAEVTVSPSECQLSAAFVKAPHIAVVPMDNVWVSASAHAPMSTAMPDHQKTATGDVAALSTDTTAAMTSVVEAPLTKTRDVAALNYVDAVPAPGAVPSSVVTFGWSGISRGVEAAALQSKFTAAIAAAAVSARSEGRLDEGPVYATDPTVANFSKATLEELDVRFRVVVLIGSATDQSRVYPEAVGNTVGAGSGGSDSSSTPSSNAAGGGGGADANKMVEPSAWTAPFLDIAPLSSAFRDREESYLPAAQHNFRRIAFYPSLVDFTMTAAAMIQDDESQVVNQVGRTVTTEQASKRVTVVADTAELLSLAQRSIQTTLRRSASSALIVTPDLFLHLGTRTSTPSTPTDPSNPSPGPSATGGSLGLDVVIIVTRSPAVLLGARHLASTFDHPATVILCADEFALEAAVNTLSNASNTTASSSSAGDVWPQNVLFVSGLDTYDAGKGAATSAYAAAAAAMVMSLYALRTNGSAVAVADAAFRTGTIMAGSTVSVSPLYRDACPSIETPTWPHPGGQCQCSKGLGRFFVQRVAVVATNSTGASPIFSFRHQGCGVAFVPLPSSGASSLGMAEVVAIAVCSVLGVVLIAVAAYALVTVCAKPASTKDNERAPQDSATPYAMVFTDIQASTKLWAEVPDQMGEALDAHHALLRAAIKKHKGYEVKTIGDSFMVAFSEPLDALAFCTAAQRALYDFDYATLAFDDFYREVTRDPLTAAGGAAAESVYQPFEDYCLLWNGLRVRIGMHVGVGDIKYDETTHSFDYYGTVVNTAARVEGVGHGGQVLLTQAAAKAVKARSNGEKLVLSDYAVLEPKISRLRSGSNLRLPSNEWGDDGGVARMPGAQSSVASIRRSQSELSARARGSSAISASASAGESVFGKQEHSERMDSARSARSERSERSSAAGSVFAAESLPPRDSSVALTAGAHVEARSRTASTGSAAFGGKSVTDRARAQSLIEDGSHGARSEMSTATVAQQLAVDTAAMPRSGASSVRASPASSRAAPHALPPDIPAKLPTSRTHEDDGQSVGVSFDADDLASAPFQHKSEHKDNESAMQGDGASAPKTEKDVLSVSISKPDDEVGRMLDEIAAPDAAQEIIDLPASLGVVSRCLGAQPLRGLPAPVVLYEVLPYEFAERKFPSLRLDIENDVAIDELERESTISGAGAGGRRLSYLKESSDNEEGDGALGGGGSGAASQARSTASAACMTPEALCAEFVRRLRIKPGHQQHAARLSLVLYTSMMTMFAATKKHRKTDLIGELARCWRVDAMKQQFGPQYLRAERSIGKDNGTLLLTIVKVVQAMEATNMGSSSSNNSSSPQQAPTAATTTPSTGWFTAKPTPLHQASQAAESPALLTHFDHVTKFGNSSPTTASPNDTGPDADGHRFGPPPSADHRGIRRNGSGSGSGLYFGGIVRNSMHYAHRHRSCSGDGPHATMHHRQGSASVGSSDGLGASGSRAVGARSLGASYSGGAALLGGSSHSHGSDSLPVPPAE